MTINEPPDLDSDAETDVPLLGEDRAVGWDWDALDQELRPRLIQVGMSRFKLSREDAEDLVQKVFAKMIALGPRARDPVGYLKASFANACLNLLRDRSRAPRNCSLGEEVEDPQARQILTRLENLMTIKKAMMELLPPCRLLISGYFLEERSLADIGRELGVTDKQAWRRIHDCVDRLRACLRR